MRSNKNLTHLLMLLLFFSCLLSLMAHSREIALKNENEKLGIVLDEINQKSTGEQMDMEEVNQIGRMDFETDDYEFSGPNNRHIPKNPGRS